MQFTGERDEPVPNSDGSESAATDISIPVLAEEVSVRRLASVTGTVRIHKTVQDREEVVDVPLRTETFDIERVPINRPIDVPPAVRQEGETTIYPVMEEVLVVSRQLMLKEELRITRRVAEVRHYEHVDLKSEAVTVERVPGEDAAKGAPLKAAT